MVRKEVEEKMKYYTGEAYMTIHKKEVGQDGMYHTTTTGCNCCEAYDTLTPDEYIELLNEMKDLIEKEIKNAKLRKRVS